jgi:5-methylcytosine-specific restriction endonuclease McrA
MLCIQCKKNTSVRKSSFCASCNRKNLCRRNKIKAVQLKGGKCQICHYDKCIQALQFHHIGEGRATKEFNISSIQHDWKKMLPELEKCILLCANCHLELHSRIDIEESYTLEQLDTILES